jgi:hypothetical protein
VTLRATAANGLAGNDVFYFGNAAGEVNRQIRDVRVTTSDLSAMRRAMSNQPVPISSIFDIDKDGRVNARDYAALLRRIRSTSILRSFQAP